MVESLAAGRPVVLDHVSTIADGIALRSVSELTLRHLEAFVERVVTVDEEQISQALLLLVERAKAVVEPAAATTLAAILAGLVGGDGPAVAILTGGNVDPLLLTRLIEHGLAGAGRYLTLRVVGTDRPGTLAAFTAELARLGLNVLDVEHHRSSPLLGVSEVEVEVTVETTNEQDHRRVIAALTAAGYRVDRRAEPRHS
jgi:threonine dehydratase